MSGEDLRWLAGVVLMLVGWLSTRWIASAQLRISAALPVDLFLPVSVFTFVLTVSARPLLAGVVTMAMGAGWARADHDKRRVLAEPIVFTDIFQALDIFRHPQLALPFPHKARMATAASATVAFFALLVWIEPPAWDFKYWLAPLFVVFTVALFRIGRSAALPSSERFWAQRLTIDPIDDSARHGSLATILLYSFLAYRQRSERQASCRSPFVHSSDSSTLAAETLISIGPVVLVQNESFFDARRLDPAIPKTLLQNFDRACDQSLQSGRFAVPSWGANTVRTEFAVLTGLTENALGFDRFNPYHRFAIRPIPSIAWTLKAAGYHTICLHPFDRRFYQRDRVLRNLGFDEFLGEEVFTDAELVNGFVADIEVARYATKLIQEHGPKLFLFIITMENHGPWSGVPEYQIDELAQLPLNSAERLSLNRYLSSIRNADVMLGDLLTATSSQALPAVIGFYGDHLPSFPSIFSKVGMERGHSDYLIWRSDCGAGKQQNLAAAELGGALLNALGSTHEVEN